MELTLENLIKGNNSEELIKLIKDLVLNNSNITILGKQGSGKTTLSKAILNCYNNNKENCLIDEESTINDIAKAFKSVLEENNCLIITNNFKDIDEFIEDIKNTLSGTALKENYKCVYPDYIIVMEKYNDMFIVETLNKLVNEKYNVLAYYDKENNKYVVN